MAMALFATMALTACSGDAALNGTWVATQASPTALVAGSRVVLTFTNGGLNGDDGCNAIGATKASISGGRLTVSSLGTGLKACSEELGKQEVWIAELLQSSPTVAINGSVMIIEGGAQKLRLEKA
jgi:heat shock protein HslJ